MSKFFKSLLPGKGKRTTIVEGRSIDAPATSSPHLAPSVSSHPFGCETLSEGVAPIIADIVFVHGLRGHRTKSWAKDDVCWPRDLLSDEEALSHIRVLTFGYDGTVVNLLGRASLNSLFEHSINLLNALSRERKQDARDRPIIFVAHSLGGLIVKDALDHSDRVRLTKPHLSHIFLATRGIIFLGTPHKGSGMNSFAEVVTAVANVTLQNPLRDLGSDSQTLDRIRDNFSRILDLRTLTVWSFVEELAIPGLGKVVNGDSAIIGDARENRESIYADHSGMAKFSTRGDDGYKKVLGAIEILLERLNEDGAAPANQGRAETVAHKEVLAFYDVPQLQIPHFVARETLFARLEQLFGRSTTSRLIVVLLGMGGAGKTQLALEYCRRMKDEGKHRAIFWLDASSRNALYRAMENIAKRLLPGRIWDDSHAAIRLVKDVLSSRGDAWLMVFDSLDDPSDVCDILDFFPNSRYGSILITSRYGGCKELGQVIELDSMGREEGLKLLLGSAEADTQGDAAEQVLIRLGHLPLAIDQARAYISRRQLRLQEFIDEYETRKQNIMQETPQFWLYRRSLPDTEEKIPLSLLTTWEMSLPLLGPAGSDAAILESVLAVFAFFHPVCISEKLFSCASKNTNLKTSPMSIFYRDGQWDHLKFERAAVQMQELSLLQFSRRNGDEVLVTLHSMVSEWLRMRLDKGSRSTVLATAVSHLENYLDSTDHREHMTRQEALSHLDSICQAKEFTEINGFFGACVSFGILYQEDGRLRDAEEMYNHALAGYAKACGPEHTSTLDTVNNLGNVYKSQGRFEDAERMYDRALAGSEKAWGPEHTSTLETVNDLGNLYLKQGRFEDAERMYNRALAGKEKAWGPEHTEHTSTLVTVNNLGVLYSEQGRFEDAERMYNRALAGYEKACGPEHTSTLDTVDNLGILYSEQGRFEDAERMHNRALAGKEQAWGPEHTSTLDTVENLGTLYAEQGRFEDAERMFIRAESRKHD